MARGKTIREHMHDDDREEFDALVSRLEQGVATPGATPDAELVSDLDELEDLVHYVEEAL